MKPDNPQHLTGWDRFVRDGIQTATGRMRAKDAAIQVLILPGLVDWSTGVGNPRYWLLRMLNDVVPADVHIFPTNMTGDPGLFGAVYGEDEGAWLLLVNKRNAAANVSIPTAVMGANAFVIDTLSGSGPARPILMQDTGIRLLPYATAAVPVCHFRSKMAKL